ncbi:MAG: Crp/Fnr family transcriptional regulator [Candidatus Edwardsbacteria bacterium]
MEDLLAEKVLKVGEILFREGDAGDEMYLIKSGKIKISKVAGGLEKTLATLQEGDFLGEMAIVDSASRSATATALEETHLLTLDREAFKTQIKENPMIEYLIESLIKRLRETNRQVEILLQKDELCRLTATLISLGREKGKETAEGMVVSGNFSPEHLAEMVGIVPQKAREISAKLEKSGMVKIDPEKLVIRSLAELEEYWKYTTLKEKFKEME